MRTWKIAGLSFDHMHMGDLLRQVAGHPNADIVGIDIDYFPVWRFLKSRGFDGPAIIETAFEDGTPRGLPMEESPRLSRKWIESSWNHAGAS